MNLSSIRESLEIGGGPGGAAGQVHSDPHAEFGGSGHTHGMSAKEIGIMVGVIVAFGVIVVGLFCYRAMRIKKRLGDQEAAVAGESCGRPATRDSIEIIDKGKGLRGGEVGSSGSFAQLFGARWSRVKGASNQASDIPLTSLNDSLR